MATINANRANLQRQIEGIADDLNYGFGTNIGGGVLFLGTWRWFDLAGKPALPELPALAVNASMRTAIDHRFATGLDGRVQTLFNAFSSARRVVDECVQAGNQRRIDGFTKQALANALAASAAPLLPRLRTATKSVLSIASRVAEVKSRLAKEMVQATDEAHLAAELDLTGVPAADEAQTTRPLSRDAQTEAVVAATFDCAILGALRPLEPGDRQSLIDGRRIPDTLADPRVVAAVFRAPRVLVPLKDDELTAYARLAFLQHWPLSASVVNEVNGMIHECRIVLAEAAKQVGALLDAEKPLDVFDRFDAADGRWLLEQLAPTDQTAFNKLGDMVGAPTSRGSIAL
jgi:hypothetical protein